MASVWRDNYSYTIRYIEFLSDNHHYWNTIRHTNFKTRKFGVVAIWQGGYIKSKRYGLPVHPDEYYLAADRRYLD